MANMFSNKDSKRIPKSLSECTQLSEPTKNLYTWAEQLECWGEWLLYALVVIGIISTLSATFEMADINDDLVFSTLLTSAVTWALYAFIEYCAYHALALLLNALATITHNTAITANVALYEASRNRDSSASEQHDSSIPCSASSAQPTDIANTAPHAPYSGTSNSPGTWVCTGCGTHNSMNYGQCKKCGKYRS